MEPRLGRMFHSSATGRRREQLFLRHSALVKRFTHEMTPREVPGREARTAKSAIAHPTSIASRAQTRGPNRDWGPYPRLLVHIET